MKKILGTRIIMTCGMTRKRQNSSRYHIRLWGLIKRLGTLICENTTLLSRFEGLLNPVRLVVSPLENSICKSEQRLVTLREKIWAWSCSIWYSCSCSRKTL